MNGHELKIGDRVAIGRQIRPGRARSGYALANAPMRYGYRPTCSCGTSATVPSKEDARIWHAGHLVAARKRKRKDGAS